MNRPALCDAPASTPHARVEGLSARALTEADVEAWVLEEQQACLHPLHAWSPENYRSSLRAGYWSRVLCDGPRVVAVCVAMDGVDEVHLLNIAVARDWHGRGLALDLLQALYQRCEAKQAQSLWLEVRPSNARARALYQREGFVDIGVRKSYYPAETGREDALVMRRDIGPHTDAEAGHALD